MKRIWLVLTTALILVGCATTYHRVGLTGGYSQTQLGENIFQVSFRGNAYTGRERASDFSLLRSAELALKHGFTHFIIIDSVQHTKQSIHTTPTTSRTTGSAYSSGHGAYGSATTTTYGGQTYLISKPRATNTIVCFKEKPEINAVVYDVKFVYTSIRNKYRIK